MNLTWAHLPRTQWDELHAAQQGALQQSWAYGDALLSLGVEIRRAMVWQEGRLLAIA